MLSRHVSWACVVLICCFVPVYGVPAGLVHHWNFDEGPDWHEDAFGSVSTSTIAYDSVGVADGYFQYMDTSACISGVQFTCLEFDGIEDHLLTSVDLASVLGDTSSLAYWVKTTAVLVAGVTGSDDIQWGGCCDQHGQCFAGSSWYLS